MTIRVLLIDDDAIARSAVETILNANDDIDVVGAGADGDEAVALVKQTAPDVVIMDLQMRRVGGVAATELVRALPNAPEVLVMTVWDVDEAVIDSLAAGAVGFITKSSSPADIVRAVRSIASGDAALSPSTTRQVIAAFGTRRQNSNAQRAQDRVKLLSPRELEVAKLVADGKTNAEIAEELFLSPHTVKPHIAEISGKLGVHGRVQIAVVLTASGYEPKIW